MFPVPPLNLQEATVLGAFVEALKAGVDLPLDRLRQDFKLNGGGTLMLHAVSLLLRTVQVAHHVADEAGRQPLMCPC